MTKLTDVNYYQLQAFYHTVLRNIGLTLSISLALMTLNRYWRSKHKSISFISYFISLMFLCISVYINLIHMSEINIHHEKLKHKDEFKLFNKWIHILKFIIATQIIIAIAYGYIGNIIYQESKKKYKGKRS